MYKNKSQMNKSRKLLPPTTIPTSYKAFLKDVKTRIRSAQARAVVSVNEELIKLYWGIGRDLVEKQEKEKWGTKLIDKFAEDIRKHFPEIEGFSRSNLFRMRAFYKAYAKVAQAVRQLEALPYLSIPWGHNIILLQKLKENIYA